MNLESIKNQYAQEQGYEDWKDLYYRLGKSIFDHQNDKFIKHEDAVIVLAEKAALEKAAESRNKFFRTAEMRDLETQLSKEEISYSRMIEIINEKADVFYRTSITNENNLVL